MKNKKEKKLFAASSIIAGTCIGAGFLGIPYVASQAGFFVAVFYLAFFSAIILLINLYFGEIILRTRKNHQLTGYAEKYLGKRGKMVALFATKFAIYSAIVAYIVGISQSISFLIFGDLRYYIFIGLLFGIFMSLLIWKGRVSLKRYEKAGVAAALILLFSISIIFFNQINISNLLEFNPKSFFVPLGVILFSMMSFFSIPQAKIVLGKDKRLLKKAIVIGTFLPAIFYFVFTLVVVGMKGTETPEIATFALGNIFILLGITAMFTSYLSLGNALQENYIFDLKFTRRKAWFKATIFPIFIFLITQLFTEFFSFIRIISIAGVVAGGIIALLILIINKRAEILGDKIPDFSIPLNKKIIVFIAVIFLLGIFFELLKLI